MIFDIRVLLATIRNLGKCPCPRCEIRKEYISGIGTTVDRQRRSHKRVDSDARIARIATARKVIFKTGAAVTSTRVENLLKPRSEVPTQVGRLLLGLLMLLMFTRMHSQNDYSHLDLIFFHCSFRICFMSLNLVSGRTHLNIWFGFSMRQAGISFKN